MEVEMFKKCPPFCREEHLEVKNVKHITCSDDFWTVKRRFGWQAQGFLELAKNEQHVKVL